MTNTGNVTLASVDVSDPTLGPVTCPAPADPGLAPGDSETCTADTLYTVTQADVDDGKVLDTATATGTDIQGDVSPISDPSTEKIDTVAAAPAVSLVKTANASVRRRLPRSSQGETISYLYVVINTGNVTLGSVAVDDPTIGTSRLSHPVPAGSGAGRVRDVCGRHSAHRHSGRRGQRHGHRHGYRHWHRHQWRHQPGQRPCRR